MSLSALRKADMISAMREQGQTATINGGAQIRCIASTPNNGRDLSEFGFDPLADLVVSILEVDYQTLPAIGNKVVFLGVSYKISSINYDGYGVTQDLTCNRFTS